VLSANVSAAQVLDGAVTSGVLEAIVNQGVTPDRVAIELTETLLAEDDIVPRALADIRDLGVAVLLDDFGTGYSSLSYLAKLPLDAVKIDRSFITEVDKRSSRAAITQAMVTMAHSLGLQVIAEGVERSEELAVVVQQGFDVYQGWHFSKALPAADLEALLAKR
jgi:EAL domain-containing protein (putative c-di-GMP-specific phosphodiesterase class I)